MALRIGETATINQDALDFRKALKHQQKEWTAGNLGIKLEESSIFTSTDFERALKKVGRRKSAQEQS